MAGSNRFLSTMQFRQALAIADMNSAQDGAYVSMENYDSVIVMVATEVGTAGSDTKVGFQQAPVVGGTGEKRLIPSVAYYASAVALGAGGTFSKATIDSTGDIELVGERQDILLVEIQASEFDVAGGYSYIQMITDAGAASGQIGGAWYIFNGARYAVDPPNWPVVNT